MPAALSLSRSPALPRPLRALLALTLAGLPLAACGADTGSNPSGGVGGDGGQSASSSNDGGAGGEDIFNPSGTGGSGSGGGEEGCATSSSEATLIPINMFITVDKSGSMDNDSKWKNAKTAFTQFFQDPSADSLRVALRFWPDDGCDEDHCKAAACQQPLVPLASLSDPAQEAALIQAFNANSPDGGTPMWAALNGATKWAIDYIAQTGGTEKAIVVLLTDGAPNGCNEDEGDIAKLASDAYAASGVLTFSVGLEGSNESFMKKIAVAGQTGQAFMIGSGNAAQDLLAALKQIQKTTVACEFQMPVPENPGDKVNPALVNVTYTPSGAGKPSTIKQVTNAGACTPVAGGWYYDDPVMPKKITLCPSTCTAVQGDEGAKIQVVLGCETIAQ